MNWFLLSENEHLGPFEEEALMELFGAGGVKADSLVWREGMDEPRTFQELFLKPQSDTSRIPSAAPEDEEDELPPELPPEVLASANASDNFEIEEIRPKPGAEGLEPSEREEGPVELESFEESKVPKEDLEAEVESGLTLAKKIKRAGIALLAIILLAAGGLYYKTHFMLFSRPSKMGAQDYQRLKAAASLDISGKNVYAFALAKDKSAVWMATNSPLSGTVVLKLTSIAGKTLSEDPIAAVSRGYLEGKLATFDTFEFEKGQRLIEGWYEVEVYTPVDLEIPLAAKFSGNWEKRFRYIDQSLLTAMKKIHFDRALEKFNQSKRENAKIFWEELEQKYRTIYAIASNIKNELAKVFEKDPARWEKSVAEFEREYAGKFGNFFTNFVIQNEKAYEEIAAKDFPDKNEVISGYTRLSRLAKEIGAKTMSSLKKLQEGESKEGEIHAAMDDLKRELLSGYDLFLQEIKDKLELARQKNR